MAPQLTSLARPAAKVASAVLQKRIGDRVFALILSAVSTIIGMTSPIGMAGIFHTAPPTPMTTTVRVWAGQTETDYNRSAVNPGGDPPAVKAYTRDGSFIGEGKSHGYLAPEHFKDYYIEPERGVGDANAAYIKLMSGGKDAVCIPAFGVQTPDGGETHIFGDALVRKCGWPGFKSFTTLTINGNEYRPWCFWLDSDSSVATQTAREIMQHGTHDEQGTYLPMAATFSLPDFRMNGSAAAYDANTDLLCGVLPRAAIWPAIPEDFPIFDPPLTYPIPTAGGDDDDTTTRRGAGAANSNFLNYAHVSDRRDWRWNYGDAFKPDEKWFEWKTSRGASGEYLAKLPLPIPEYVKHENVAASTAPAPGGRRRRSSSADEQAAASRSGASPSQRWRGTWVTSHSTAPDMQADLMCSLPNIVGPDFANTVGRRYCDMETRTVYDFCGGDDEHATGCFDFAREELRMPVAGARLPGKVRRDNAAAVAQPGGGGPTKELKRRVDWGDI